MGYGSNQRRFSSARKCPIPSHFARSALSIEGRRDLQCIRVDLTDRMETVIDFVDSFDIRLWKLESHKWNEIG